MMEMIKCRGYRDSAHSSELSVTGVECCTALLEAGRSSLLKMLEDDRFGGVGCSGTRKRD